MKPRSKHHEVQDIKPDPEGVEPGQDVPIQKLKEQLGYSPDGLESLEAKNRLTKFGKNKLEEVKTNPYLQFLKYFWGPIPWMIEVAAILSLLVKHWADFGIILTLLLVNAVVGFWEEYQAGNTIAALKAKLALQARVKRDGKWTVIQAEELVPGDLIRIRLGDIIPADARLLEGGPVQVDQSVLTGESLPVTCNNGDTVFSSSILKQGEADALVFATGLNTYFGKTADLAKTTSRPSHFQRAVLKIGNYLIILAIGLMVLILAFAILRGDNLITTLQFALILTIAAIPVAMPTVLSITMAVGARKLAKKQAIVSKLASIEELAGVDVLCSDKTGTLTQNKLTLGNPYVVGNMEPDKVILYAALASRAEDQDQIDLAVIGGVKDKNQLGDYKLKHYQPFDPESKRAEATLIGPGGQEFMVTKGALQVILELSANSGKVKEEAEKAVNEFAAKGYRSLGVARTDTEREWQFLGILPLYDPPRADSKSTIDTAQKLGVQVKMITGDQLAIGKEIARQLDLGTNILDAGVLSKFNQSGNLTEEIDEADGFAQVLPEHKYQIVNVLQKQGHIVGMTGDGVNDAPALSKADAGIAVSGATDAARNAADIVLLSEGLSVIIDAIEESRNIFKRMNSYTMYRIAETIRVLLFMTLSILVFNFYPVTAVMIVLLALLNDGAILAIAYDHVQYSEHPERWDMVTVLSIASVLGIFGLAASFGLFYIGEQVFHLNHELLQTLMYLKLSVAGHLTIFITRTRGPFWSLKPAPILLGAVGVTQLTATLIAVYGLFMTPIGWRWALIVWVYAIFWFFVNDRVKLVTYKILDQRHTTWASNSAG